MGQETNTTENTNKRDSVQSSVVNSAQGWSEIVSQRIISVWHDGGTKGGIKVVKNTQTRTSLVAV